MKSKPGQVEPAEWPLVFMFVVGLIMVITASVWWIIDNWHNITVFGSPSNLMALGLSITVLSVSLAVILFPPDSMKGGES